MGECIEFEKNNFIYEYGFIRLFVEMKKSIIVVLCVFILIIVIWMLIFKKTGIWDIMDWPWMVKDIQNYSVDIKERWEFPWEDIYVYDDNGNLVLSLEDKNQPQYYFALYENYLILDSGTSASEREMLVYDIKSGNKIFETVYYPWEDWLILDGDNIIFYKEIGESLYWDYTLPNCENEYDNGYVEIYGYTIWEDQANDLGNVKCAYFE